MESVVRLEPIDTIKHGISSAAGIQCSIVAFFLFGIIAGLIIWRGSGKESYDERNFEISQKGTYGTAGFMGEEERSQVLRTDKNLEKVDGVIFGRDIQDKKIISLPVESRLNRNFAVCGSQGSMKSRAFARVMALQCIRRGGKHLSDRSKIRTIRGFVLLLPGMRVYGETVKPDPVRTF